jgi:hypothetical protein
MNLNLCDVFRIEVCFSSSAVAAEAADVDIELSLGHFVARPTSLDVWQLCIHHGVLTPCNTFSFLFFALVIPHTFRHLYFVVRQRQENGYLDFEYF